MMLTRAQFNCYIRGFEGLSAEEQSNKIAFNLLSKLERLKNESFSLRQEIVRDTHALNQESSNLRERLANYESIEALGPIGQESLERILHLSDRIDMNIRELGEVKAITERIKNLYIQFLELPD